MLGWGAVVNRMRLFALCARFGGPLGLEEVTTGVHVGHRSSGDALRPGQLARRVGMSKGEDPDREDHDHADEKRDDQAQSPVSKDERVFLWHVRDS